MFGGAMRQVGFFAAAGLHAIEHNFDRLAEDHANARLIAGRLSENPKFIVDLSTVQTNILVFDLADTAPDAATIVTGAKERGVLVFAFGPRTIRAVTHLDVSREQCERAADVFLELIGN
jgi:threonine aldolase